MVIPKVDIRKLDQLLREGKTVTECAKHFDVTPLAPSPSERKSLNTKLLG